MGYTIQTIRVDCSRAVRSVKKKRDEKDKCNKSRSRFACSLGCIRRKEFPKGQMRGHCYSKLENAQEPCTLLRKCGIARINGASLPSTTTRVPLLTKRYNWPLTGPRTWREVGPTYSTTNPAAACGCDRVVRAGGLICWLGRCVRLSLFFPQQLTMHLRFL